MTEQKQLNLLQGHNSTICHLAISNDREFIASCDIDGVIKVWGIKD